MYLTLLSIQKIYFNVKKKTKHCFALKNYGYKRDRPINLICVFLINTCFLVSIYKKKVTKKSPLSCSTVHHNIHRMFTISSNLLTDQCNNKIINHIKIMFHLIKPICLFSSLTLLPHPSQALPIINIFSFTYNIQ